MNEIPGPSPEKTEAQIGEQIGRITGNLIDRAATDSEFTGGSTELVQNPDGPTILRNVEEGDSGVVVTQAGQSESPTLGTRTRILKSAAKSTDGTDSRSTVRIDPDIINTPKGMIVSEQAGDKPSQPLSGEQTVGASASIFSELRNKTSKNKASAEKARKQASADDQTVDSVLSA